MEVYMTMSMYLSEWWLYISLHLQIVLWSILGKKCPSHVKTQTPSMCGILTYIYRKNQFSFSDIQLVLLCSTVGGKGRMNKAGTFAFSNSFLACGDKLSSGVFLKTWHPDSFAGNSTPHPRLSIRWKNSTDSSWACFLLSCCLLNTWR